MIRMHRVAAISAIALFAAQPVQAETLREAIAWAYETNPLLAEANARQEAVEELTAQAKAEGRLNLTAEATVGYDALGSGEAASAQITSDLPIWTGGRVASSVRAAEFEVAAGDQRVRDIEAQVLEQVVTAYADVLFAQEAADVARIGIERLGLQINEAQARFDLGEATLTDVAQLRTQRAAVAANLADAVASLATASAAYRESVGRMPGDLEATVPDPQLPGDLDTARAVTRERNPLVLEQERLAEASQARTQRARAERSPLISLGGSYGRGARLANNDLRGFESAATVGLTLRMPLLNGGLLNSRIREAEALSRADVLAIDALERGAVRAVDTAWAQLEAAKSRLAANAEGLESAQLALNGVKAEYEFGLRSTIDILLAEESFRSAQLALARSQSDLIIQQVRLLRSTGTLERNVYL